MYEILCQVIIGFSKNVSSAFNSFFFKYTENIKCAISSIYLFNLYKGNFLSNINCNKFFVGFFGIFSTLFYILQKSMFTSRAKDVCYNSVLVPHQICVYG